MTDPVIIARLLIKVEKLERGCHCDYDYRCGNCQTIIDAKALAAEIVNGMQVTKGST